MQCCAVLCVCVCVCVCVSVCVCVCACVCVCVCVNIRRASIVTLLPHVLLVGPYKTHSVAVSTLCTSIDSVVK